MAESILSVSGLVKTFGGLTAVDDVSFELKRGTILGLIGINGAGKTTLMNCVSGLYRCDAGKIVIEGQDATHRTPHEITAIGVGRTFQVPRTFRRMSVVDNVMVPMLRSRLSDEELIERADRCLDQVGLLELRRNNGEELSGGQQKLLELARVMMFDPSLILLDEPFAGVNPTLCRIIIEQVEALRESGRSFLLVSHDLTSIYRLSDRLVVLNAGEIIAEGGVDEVRNNPDVIEAYLGSPT